LDLLVARLFALSPCLQSLLCFTGPPKVPLFMLASASEGKKQQAKTKAKEAVEAASAASTPAAPAWRVALGNLAAGAVSGCAVEAGEWPP
jgi:hypothetical protein